MTELRPAPNSVVEAVRDAGRLGAGVEPAARARALDACVARVSEATSTIGEDRRRAAEAVDERSPAAETSDVLFGARRRGAQTIENGIRFVNGPALLRRATARYRVERATVPSGVPRRARVSRRTRTRGPRPHRPRRRSSLRREGLPRRDDRRTSSAERPIGRGHLHVLQGQGRAVPRRAATSSSARRASTSWRYGWRRRRTTAEKLAVAIALLHRDHRRVRGRAWPGRPRPGLGGGRRRAARPRDAGSPARATRRGGPRCSCTRASPAASYRPGSTSTRSRAFLAPARRTAAPAHRGRRRAIARPSSSAGRAPCSTSSSAAAGAQHRAGSPTA